MIGQRYDSETWNCVHEVMQWYEQHGCPDVLKPSDMSEWGVRFVLWMRRHFTPINAPEQGALVVMRNRYTGGLHVGVWDKGMIHHCYQPLTGGLGQAIRSPLCLVKSAHVILKYGRYNGAHSLL